MAYATSRIGASGTFPRQHDVEPAFLLTPPGRR
jgi:hypothetical protein